MTPLRTEIAGLLWAGSFLLTLELTPDCMLIHMARSGIQIGRVAEQTGLSVDAIRFYEKQKLLGHPQRTAGGFRLFNEQEIGRIEFIRRAQQLGFSLPEIRELLILQREEGEACSHVRDLLRAKVAEVRNRIQELGILEQQLTKSLRKCERQLKTRGEGHAATEACCPVLEQIAQGALR